MKFRKVTVLVSLFVVCFVLAAQSAKADDILFNDLVDTNTITNLQGTAATSRLVGVLCPSNGDICTATLLAPTGFSALAQSIIFYLGETTLTGIISDDFVATVGSVGATFKFDSNLPGAGEATGLGPCPAVVGCNAVENGNPQLVGTITWINLTNPSIQQTDNIYMQSDLETAGVVPEPASLILFGSGLVMAGGFMRRRRRLITSPV